MNKPVIILGGGIWGSLLAWRLKEALPQVKFLLFEESSCLGDFQVHDFGEADCFNAMKWLRPLITYSWSDYELRLTKTKKFFRKPYHLIDWKKLNNLVTDRLGNHLKLNNNISQELALQEGSFVIDTRPLNNLNGICKKYYLLEIELEHDHYIKNPIVIDARDGDKKLRVLSFFPFSERSLLIKDTWYISQTKMSAEEIKMELTHELNLRGWKIKSIKREDSGAIILPFSKPFLNPIARVVSLGDIFHDSTGQSIAIVTELIDKMVLTSFRYGEINEIVKNFRQKLESQRKFFRTINKKIVLEGHSYLLDSIYSHPSLLERFTQGRLTYFDKQKLNMDYTTQSIQSFARRYFH